MLTFIKKKIKNQPKKTDKKSLRPPHPQKAQAARRLTQYESN